MQENNQEKSHIKQRILHYLSLKGISQYDCYAKTGITRGILGQNNGISEQNLVKFLAYYKEVSCEWLILGEGEMIKGKSDFDYKEYAEENKMVAEEAVAYTKSNIYYDMFKQKDAEVGDLKEEIGALKAKIRYLETEDQEKG